MKRSLLAVLALGITPPVLAQSDATDAVVLTGATVINGDYWIESASIIVRDGRIECVGEPEACSFPEDAEIIDLDGHYITPGLVDAHVHFAQTGWLDGRPDGMQAPDVYPYPETAAALRANPDRWHAAYLCTGITAVYDVGGQAWTVTSDHATDTERSDRAHVRAAGPLITHASDRNRFFLGEGAADQPLFLPMEDVAGVREQVRYLESIGAQAVKVWYLAPRPDDRDRLDGLLMEIGAAADAAGLPMIVHATSLREAKMALRAGAAMLVHSVSNQPVDQEFLDLLTGNDAVYVPTLQAGPNWGRALASVAFAASAPIDDPNGCVDEAIRARINAPERMPSDLISPAWAYRSLEGNGAEIALMQQNLMAVFEAGGRIATATDAGNPMTLHGPSIYREMEMMQAAGLSPQAVIEMSTRGGAVAMGAEDEFGQIEAGFVADLIVLSEDPREDVRNFRSLTHVMRAGVLRAQSELRVTQVD